MVTDLRNHIPYKLLVKNNIPEVQWLHTASVPYTAPFFDETILQCLTRNPGMARFKCISSLETMIEASEYIESVPVTAFIFHISRCGSTLLSQTLGLSERNIVLAEVPFFDAVLRSDFPDSDTKKRALRAAVKLYGQKRNDTSDHYYIKLDSWSVYYWELLRELWPETPLLLLYRNPADVLRSHQKKAGMQAVPGLLEPELFDITREQVPTLNSDLYLGKVLTYYFRQFEVISRTSENYRLVSYHQGIENMLQIIQAVTGVVFDENFIEQAVKRSRFHSKDHSKVFAEAIPEQPVTVFLKDAFEGFEKLESLRLASL